MRQWFPDAIYCFGVHVSKHIAYEQREYISHLRRLIYRIRVSEYIAEKARSPADAICSAERDMSFERDMPQAARFE